tara:strand:+ start:215 stop:1114 length:900 start_codon:yes stop_codon:yes gene_type:complete
MSATYANEKEAYYQKSRDEQTYFHHVKNQPDKPRDFPSLSENPNLRLKMLQAFPDANWDYAKLLLHNNLDIDWIPHIPQQKRDFRTLSNNKNFCLDWFLQYPKEDWDPENILYLELTFKYLIIYQYHHPQEQVLCTLPPLLLNEIDDNPIPLILLNKGNLRYLKNNISSESQELISQMGYWLEKELTEEEKTNILRLCDFEYDFDEFYPDVLYNMDTPLALQDLSGDIFEVDDWLESDDIFSLIFQNHPELRGSKFVISEENKKKDFIANEETSEKFKDKLLENKEGPFAIIFYPKVEE